VVPETSPVFVNEVAFSGAVAASWANPLDDDRLRSMAKPLSCELLSLQASAIELPESAVAVTPVGGFSHAAAPPTRASKSGGSQMEGPSSRQGFSNSSRHWRRVPPPSRQAATSSRQALRQALRAETAEASSAAAHTMNTASATSIVARASLVLRLCSITMSGGKDSKRRAHDIGCPNPLPSPLMNACCTPSSARSSADPTDSIAQGQSGMRGSSAPVASTPPFVRSNRIAQ
jgi:hypothetical protein